MKRAIVGAVITALSVASVSNAALFSGWNNTPDGWERETGNVAPALAYSSTIGVTEGSASLQLQAPTGFSLLAKTFSGEFNIALINAGVATSPVLIAVDVTIPSDSFGTSGTYFEINFPYTGSETAFQNILVPATSFIGAGPQTIYFTLPAGVRGTSPSFFGIFLGVNTDRAPVTGLVYFDNFRISPIPEPASLGLIGALGLGLLARRR